MKQVEVVAIGTCYVDTAVDEAYRVKYAGSPYLDGPFTLRMRATTVRLMPSD